MTRTSYVQDPASEARFQGMKVRSSCPAYKPVQMRKTSRQDTGIARPNISISSAAAPALPERANIAGSAPEWLAGKSTSERKPARAALALVHASVCEIKVVRSDGNVLRQATWIYVPVRDSKKNEAMQRPSRLDI
ncbi:hypothetical protein HDV63DRAFT_369976 [Trichoderma sp. SZMC 28014]